MDEKYETMKLPYTIHKYSSYSASYVPENIMVNKPSDQLSRWFTDSSTSSQFIVLKLQGPSIVETIKFGKYTKPHVSDLKKFQILGGTDENNLSLLLSSGLNKDSAPETFRLRHKTQEGLFLPVTYIKIVPLQSWGPAYNYTIWYVELHGKNQTEFIAKAMETINLRKEEEAVRILLKHLRRRRYRDAFEALSRESGVRLEGATQGKLWNALVEQANYKLAEEIFEQAVDNGELDWYMSWQPYRPEWRQMSACSSQVEERLSGTDTAPRARPANNDLLCNDREPALEGGVGSTGGVAGAGSAECVEMCGAWCGTTACCNKPGPRGGHQLVCDSTTGTLYLFGGWNGTEDLDDLWSYCTSTERWRLLCGHSSLVGGPTPRSCHKMVFDPVQRRLYTLGRYLDNAQRIPGRMNCELHSYCVRSGRWALECADTGAAGGPRLVFDHQMCIDPDTRTLYVFGGRVMPANSDEVASVQYSGLYAYYIATNTWQQLLPDKHSLPAPQPRVSHSMLFHPIQRRLYIFAGQRNREHLLDLWWWDVGTGEAHALCAASSAVPPPGDGFTQRATLDPDTDEMFVLSGMSKEKDKRVYNTLWAFSLRRMSWTCVYRNDAVAPTDPRPRFAHQLVYDPVRKVHYLFGGNPGMSAQPRLRLDDLWSLRLTRTPTARVVQEARVALREACYRELASTPRVPATATAALHYLRNELAAVLDHSDPVQVSRFQKLATALFAGRSTEYNVPALTARRTRALARRRARPPAPADPARALAQVLGADDNSFEPIQPYEDIPEPVPDTWDVGDDDDDAALDADWDARQARVNLFDKLCTYFRPTTVPPRADIMDLVVL